MQTGTRDYAVGSTLVFRSRDNPQTWYEMISVIYVNDNDLRISSNKQRPIHHEKHHSREFIPIAGSA